MLTFPFTPFISLDKFEVVFSVADTLDVTLFKLVSRLATLLLVEVTVLCKVDILSLFALAWLLAESAVFFAVLAVLWALSALVTAEFAVLWALLTLVVNDEVVLSVELTLWVIPSRLVSNVATLDFVLLYSLCKVPTLLSTAFALVSSVYLDAFSQSDAVYEPLVLAVLHLITSPLVPCTHKSPILYGTVGVVVNTFALLSANELALFALFIALVALVFAEFAVFCAVVTCWVNDEVVVSTLLTFWDIPLVVTSNDATSLLRVSTSPWTPLTEFPKLVVVFSKLVTLPLMPFTLVSNEPTLLLIAVTVEPSAFVETVCDKLDTFWDIASVVTFISALALSTLLLEIESIHSSIFLLTFASAVEYSVNLVL